MSLMKSLSESYVGAPMAPPQPGWDFDDDKPPANTVTSTEHSSNQHPGIQTLQLEPGPLSTPETPRANTSPNTDESHLEFADTTNQAVGLPSQVAEQTIPYKMALDGVSLERLMLGAAVAAVPGVETASTVYTVVASGAQRISRTVRQATQLSKSFRGVRCTDENILSDWVVVSSQDPPKAE